MLKNKMLDVDDVCSYRPVSNLPFLSKVIEKCVHIQIDMYLCENFLYGEFQSVTDLISAVKQLLLKLVMIFCLSLIPNQMLCYFCLILLLPLTL